MGGAHPIKRQKIWSYRWEWSYCAGNAESDAEAINGIQFLLVLKNLNYENAECMRLGYWNSGELWRENCRIDGPVSTYYNKGNCRIRGDFVGWSTGSYKQLKVLGWLNRRGLIMGENGVWSEWRPFIYSSM